MIPSEEEDKELEEEKQNCNSPDPATPDKALIPGDLEII